MTIPAAPVGYLAASLVFATFYAKRMVPLRTLAIASNIAFMAYGYLDALWPILILHATLLPMNVIRLLDARGSLVSWLDDYLDPGRLAARARRWLRRRRLKALRRRGVPRRPATRSDELV